MNLSEVSNWFLETAAGKQLVLEHETKTHNDRRARVSAFEQDSAALRQEAEAFDMKIAKAKDKERRVAAELLAAKQSTAGLRSEQMKVTGKMDRLRREFEGAMRANGPADLVHDFSTRVLRLIDESKITRSTLTRRYNGENHDAVITNAESVNLRRHALFALRQAVISEWIYLPLSQSEFEEKFTAAVAALPALEPPELAVA
jgi:hypothetical protein